MSTALQILEPGEQKVHSLYEKLHLIMSELDYIQKDKKNTFHGYTYASEAAIKNAVHRSLSTHRVIFFPTSSTILEMKGGMGAKGDETVTTVRLSYDFIDIDTGEKLSGTFDGTGADKGDKGAYKAITGALKYALTSTFLIETGDQADPENDAVVPTPEERKQQAQIAKQEQQLIAAKKIEALKQEEPPKPKLEIPPAFQKIKDELGTNKELILAKLSDMQLELLEALDGDAEASNVFVRGLQVQYGDMAFADMPVGSLLRVVYRVWTKINEGNRQKVVNELPLGVGADAPLWVEQPSQAAKAGLPAHTSYIESEKGKRGRK